MTEQRLAWTDSYSVGVPLLDSQHKGLIDLINRLTDAPSDGAVTGWIIEELDAYTREHFAAEEALLKRAGYQDLKRHKSEHAAFEHWLSAVRQAYATGVASPDMLSENIAAFLREWLVNHILRSDMAYRDDVGALSDA